MAEECVGLAAAGLPVGKYGGIDPISDKVPDLVLHTVGENVLIVMLGLKGLIKGVSDYGLGPHLAHLVGMNVEDG